MVPVTSFLCVSPSERGLFRLVTFQESPWSPVENFLPPIRAVLMASVVKFLFFSLCGFPPPHWLAVERKIHILRSSETPLPLFACCIGVTTDQPNCFVRFPLHFHPHELVEASVIKYSLWAGSSLFENRSRPPLPSFPPLFFRGFFEEIVFE